MFRLLTLSLQREQIVPFGAHLKSGRETTPPKGTICSLWLIIHKLPYMFL